MTQPLRQIIHGIAKVIVVACMMMPSACATDETRISGYGWISLQTHIVETDAAPAVGVLSLTIATDDGAYSGTWNDADMLSRYETFQIGRYQATALSGTPDAEGYGCQCYVGTAEFAVVDGGVTPVDIESTLQQALAYVHIAPSADDVAVEGITLHTSGYGYNDVDLHSEAPLLIMPGATQCYVKLRNEAGTAVTLCMPSALATKRAAATNIDIELSDDKLVLSTQSGSQTIDLAAGIWDGEGPTITTRGFQSGVPISLIEGYPSSQPLIMEIASDVALQSATLTLKGSYLADQGVPTDCNLLDMPQHIADMGLEATKIADNKLIVDFTRFIENLNVEYNDVLEFTVDAADVAGRVSQVATLSFTILSVDLQLMTVTPAVIGENYAVVTLGLSVDQAQRTDFTAYVECEGEREQIDLEVLRIDSDSRIATVGFYVPEGIDEVMAEIYYMDIPKLRFEVPRQVPGFTINVDAFAHSAVIAIGASDEEKQRALTSYANVYANGVRTTIVNRDVETSQITVIGLQPECQYDIVVEVLPNQFTAVEKTITEDDAPVPMGDFEDFEYTYEFKNIPSGGIYSSAAFPIFNNQNFASFSGTWVTKYWTSVNDKTLCKEAERYNTWYMQPSAWLDFDNYASGLKSMHLVSVGWSLHGQDIPPYMQASDSHIDYNANSPAPDHVSAGKLFLGSYSFDASTCTETYSQGIEFDSRPSSLNGFYKYLPDANHDTDRGLVIVELLNDIGVNTQVIAHAELKLEASPDFVSFNVPITYAVPNLKASRLKILFATSDGEGSIEEEDRNVPVSTDLKNARFAGSELWVDNLSFTY